MWNNSNKVPLAAIRRRNRTAPMVCSRRPNRASSVLPNSRRARSRVPIERPAAMVLSTNAPTLTSSRCPSSSSRKVGVAYLRMWNSSNKVPLAAIRRRNRMAPMVCSRRPNRSTSASPSSRRARLRVPMERPAAMVLSTNSPARTSSRCPSSSSRKVGVAY